MGDTDEPAPGSPLAEAERRVKAAINTARDRGDAALLAIRHAELGMILAAQGRHAAAVGEHQTSLGYVQLLRSEGSHEHQRLVRMTSLSAKPPGQADIDLDRLEVEVRVALVEAYAAVGDLTAAQHELARARPMSRGLFRRRLRRRLDRVAGLIVAGPGGAVDLAEVRRQLGRGQEPAQERALRLKLANGLLDARDFGAAAHESLLLVRSADEAGDAVVRAGARQVLGLALEGQGRDEEALPILRDAFRDLRNHGDAAGMIGMAEALAHRLLKASQASAAATVLRSAQRAAADSGDVAAQLSAGTMLGVVLDESGDRAAALETLNGVAAQAQRLGRPMAQADALHSAAVALGAAPRADEVVEALTFLDEAKRIYAGNSCEDRVAGCDHEAAALLGRQGAHDAAVARYEAALRTYRKLPPRLRDTGDWPDEVADCEANLAWLRGDRAAVPPGLFQSGGHSMTHALAG